MNKKKIVEKPYETLRDPKKGRLVLVAILILALLFVPIYYMAMSKVKSLSEKDVAKHPEPSVQLNEESKVDKSPGEAPLVEAGANTNGGFEEDIYEGLKKWNTDEIKKVKDFLDIKANRTATMELIKKAMEAKEGYYARLVANKSGMSSESYTYYESAIIKSLAMSEEFLGAFDSKSTISDLKVIIEKYTK